MAKKPGLTLFAARQMETLINRLTGVLPPGKSSSEFRSNGTLTLGVEWELQLVDSATYELVPKADSVLKSVSSCPKIKPELYLDMIEINSDKCSNVREVEKDLSVSIAILQNAGMPLGIVFSGGGSHPLSNYSSADIYPSDRYNDLIDRNQWLTRRWKVYGLHVHLGMKSGDDCIRFNNFFMPLLPLFLALSSSAPFWQGQDTGLSTCRPTIYEALPTAGQPYPVQNWGEFISLCDILQKSGAIKSLKDLWWDVRPSPAYGTLEIRVCDSPTTLAEVCTITAFIHALAHWFQDHGEWLQQVPQPPHWLMRENKWRVIRYGLDADMVINQQGENRPIRQEIIAWINKISPYARKLGYQDYMRSLEKLCVHGSSVQRQREVFATSQNLQDVARFNAQEFAAGIPVWPQQSGIQKIACN